MKNSNYFLISTLAFFSLLFFTSSYNLIKPTHKLDVNPNSAKTFQKNHPIDRKIAEERIARYRASISADQPFGYEIPISDLEVMTQGKLEGHAENVTSVAIVFGLDENNRLSIIAMPIDENGNEVPNEEGYSTFDHYGQCCPPRTSAN